MVNTSPLSPLILCARGHEARKRTWLYVVGCDLPALSWREPPAVKQVSAYGLTNGASRRTYATALDKGKSSYTPESFRDVLLDMARSAALHRLEGCT